MKHLPQLAFTASRTGLDYEGATCQQGGITGTAVITCQALPKLRSNSGVFPTAMPCRAAVRTLFYLTAGKIEKQKQIGTLNAD